MRKVVIMVGLEGQNRIEQNKIVLVEHSTGSAGFYSKMRSSTCAVTDETRKRHS